MNLPKISSKGWVIAVILFCSLLDFGSFLYAIISYPELLNREMSLVIRLNLGLFAQALVYVLIHGVLIYFVLRQPKKDSNLKVCAMLISSVSLLHLFGAFTNITALMAYRSGSAALINASAVPMGVDEQVAYLVALTIICGVITFYSELLLFVNESLYREKYDFVERKKIKNAN